jgi:hypothetical protein
MPQPFIAFEYIYYVFETHCIAVYSLGLNLGIDNNSYNCSQGVMG